MLIVLSLILAGCVFLPLDGAISSRLMDGLLPGDVREILRRAEAFGHGFGLIAIAVTIYFLDRQWASRVPRLLTHGLAAGLLADVIKMSVWRVRPRFADLVEQSFTGTFLSASGKDWSNVLDSRYHSFPSAHTAVAVAAAVTLGRFYPPSAAGFYAWRCVCGATCRRRVPLPERRLSGRTRWAMLSPKPAGIRLAWPLCSSAAVTDWTATRSPRRPTNRSAAQHDRDTTTVPATHIPMF